MCRQGGRTNHRSLHSESRNLDSHIFEKNLSFFLPFIRLGRLEIMSNFKQNKPNLSKLADANKTSDIGSKAGNKKKDAVYISASQRIWLFGLFLAAATFFSYFPALRGGFVWDDDSWTTKIINLLRDTSGLRLMWFQPTALQQYYPLSGTTFWLDYHLWKFWTTPYHVENVLLHILAALLFWRLLLRLRVPGAWLACAIFALHPLMVESVAWITERKNVLSMVLCLSAFLAYGRYQQWWETDPTAPFAGSLNVKRHKVAFYSLALILFLLAMLAKTTVFSLPAALILIGWWKRGKIQWRTDVLPTLPFFLISFLLCATTSWLEKHHLNAQGQEFALSFPQRCLVAGRVFWFYLGKLFWPANLCFVYTRWQTNPGLWWQWLAPVTALGSLFLFWLARARIGRGPITALLLYVGALFPLLGFMDAYGMRYSFVWNHWVYLPSLGIIALISSCVVRLAERLRSRSILYGFAMILLALGALTRRDCAMYSDGETLWRVTLARNPDAWLAHTDLGVLLDSRGQINDAIIQFKQALHINPDNAEACNALGNDMLIEGHPEEAISDFEKALDFQPGYAAAESNLGGALVATGDFKQASAAYEAAIKSEPYNEFYLNNLAWFLATCPQADFRNGHEAVQLAEQACKLTDYTQTQLIGTLAAAYAEAGRFDDAVAAAQKACDLATLHGEEDLLQKNQQMLQLYRTHKAYHEWGVAYKIRQFQN